MSKADSVKVQAYREKQHKMAMSATLGTEVEEEQVRRGRGGTKDGVEGGAENDYQELTPNPSLLPSSLITGGLSHIQGYWVHPIV